MQLGEIIKILPMAAPISHRIQFSISTYSGDPLPVARALGTDRWNSWQPAFYDCLDDGLLQALKDRT